MDNRGRVWNPEKYCPICGAKFGSGPPGPHRCPEATLRGIDRAGATDDRDPVRTPSFEERIKDGFDLLEDE